MPKFWRRWLVALPLDHLPVISRGGPLGPPRPLQVLARAPHRYARARARLEVQVHFACFACGSTGHFKADCPELHPPPPSPEALGASTPTPGGVGYRPMDELRRVVPAEVTSELADRYGSQIRAAMGWGLLDREDRLQRLAQDQVAESRGIRVNSKLIDKTERNIAGRIGPKPVGIHDLRDLVGR